MASRSSLPTIRCGEITALTLSMRFIDGHTLKFYIYTTNHRDNVIANPVYSHSGMTPGQTYALFP